MQVKNKKTKWSDLEHEILLNCLAEGLTCRSIELLLPNRTEKSIRRKALRLGWSSYTLNGNIYFRFGIKKRNKKKDENLQNIHLPLSKKIHKIITQSLLAIYFFAGHRHVI